MLRFKVEAGRGKLRAVELAEPRSQSMIILNTKAAQPSHLGLRGELVACSHPAGTQVRSDEAHLQSHPEQASMDRRQKR